MRTGRACFLSIAVAVAVVRAGNARAESAEQLFEEGSSAMERQSFNEACDLFRKSYDLSKATGPLLGLAACTEARGALRDALALWREAERTLPENSPNLPLVRAAVRRLSDRVAVLSLEVDRNAPATTEVQVDGHRVARDARTVEVDPGVAHEVVAVAPGYEARRVEVKLDEGEHRTVRATPGASSGHDPIGPVRGTGIALAALGGVGIITAAVTGGVLLAETQTMDDECAGPNHTLCSAGALSASDSAHHIAPWNVAAWVVGVAGLGAGIPMAIIGDHAKDKTKPPPYIAAVRTRGSSVVFECKF